MKYKSLNLFSLLSKKKKKTINFHYEKQDVLNYKKTQKKKKKNYQLSKKKRKNTGR